MNGFSVKQENWKRLPSEEKEWLLFDAVQDMHKRIARLESWNKPFALIGGIVGGFLAALGCKWVLK